MRFLFGLALGTVVGLIVAPASGEQTRARLAAQIDTTAREKARELGARAGETAYQKLKDKAL